MTASLHTSAFAFSMRLSETIPSATRHWCLLQPLRDPDTLCSWDNPTTSRSLLQTVCYTTRAAAEQMTKGMRCRNCRVKIEVNIDLPDYDRPSNKGIIESTYLSHDASLDSWVNTIDLKLQTCARQSVVVRQKREG